MSSRFERLPGLPGTGPVPEQFSETGLGRHQEGLVVRFTPANGEAWVGNFQSGLAGYEEILPHPDGRHIVVVAGGQGYIIDPETRRLTGCVGGAIDAAYQVAEPPLLIVADGNHFEALGAGGFHWRTRRLSWDGFRNVTIRGGQLLGEAWDPMNERRCPFEVDLATGAAAGGSFGTSW